MTDDLVSRIQYKLDELERSVRALRNTGRQAAEAERDYKIQLSKTTLMLREQGYAVGIIEKVIYGNPEVAELRFKRDIAQTIYEANREHINATKLEIRILESQVQREYGMDLSD